MFFSDRRLIGESRKSFKKSEKSRIKVLNRPTVMNYCRTRTHVPSVMEANFSMKLISQIRHERNRVQIFVVFERTKFLQNGHSEVAPS
jgi:hypothetical protein